MKKPSILLGFMTGVLAGMAALAADTNEYLPGGPLAGLKLPLMATQHGEPAGYPGALGDKAPLKASNPKLSYETQGIAPQLELYPGSVELFQDYMQKYTPVRSFFDRQSQLKNWKAADLPGLDKSALETYAAPLFWVGRHSVFAETGLKRAPVQVARLKAGGAAITLDLGRLPAGLYAVRLIGAVEPGQVKAFRRPLVIRAAVNDGPAGEETAYRIRAGYCEEFYDVADVYFQVQEERDCRVTLQSDAASEVDLLLHNVTLDDALAGTVRRPIKTRAIETLKSGITSAVPKIAGEARLARDANLWNSYVPLNALGGSISAGGYASIAGVSTGTETLTGKEIEDAHGAWTLSEEPGVLMANAKLKLRYTLEDLKAARPLPDPYPFKDDGLGLLYPSTNKPGEGRVWAPIAYALSQRTRSYLNDAGRASLEWVNTGNADAARDGAVKLIRFALAFPSLDDGNTLNALVREPAAFNRGYRARSRESGGGVALGHFEFQFRVAATYDRLFSYIQGNEELARSIGRFVPSVKSSADLIQLLDVYLLQTHAKRILRYHYQGDGREPAMLADVAAVLGDNAVTEPWMQWLFARTFYYPHPLAGLPDYLVSATEREGRSTIGSMSYVMGDESAAAIAQGTDYYIKHGGDPAFNLADPQRFPKVISALFFPLRTRTAGLWPLRIGTVTGPDKSYDKNFDHLLAAETLLGWRWTADPRFAFIIRNFGKREDWTDKEWADIEAAAATVKRAPWMDQASRVLPGYAAVLESGLEHDDFRFRRSAMLRIGTGTGHAHMDTLDLQLHAHGVPMTMDAGQRPGYSSPDDGATRVHNTVEVDSRNWVGPDSGPASSYVQSLADLPGARYLQAQVVPSGLARLARRQIALIDADDGQGSVPLPPQAYGPRPAGLPTNVVTANAYVLDVFRVAGGSAHTYCMHSHVNDVTGSNQPRHNVEAVENLTDPPAAEGTPAAAVQAYLRSFSGQRWFGRAPDSLAVDFSLQKTRPKSTGIDQAGTEARLMGALYDAGAPDKVLRWRLLGQAGALVMKGDLNCVQWNYQIPNLFVQSRGENLESAFVAIIEPFAGKPFIQSVERLAIPGNSTGALQAVAVRVATVNGRTDLCLADGEPDRIRQATPQVRFAGEFAYASTDARGLRQASLSGGTLLALPQVTIKAAASRRSARIVKVDYAGRQVWLDQPWPACRAAREVELRTAPADQPGSWRTSFTTTAWEPEGQGTRIRLLHSADLFRSQINRVDPAAGRVETLLTLPVMTIGFKGGWTASDDLVTQTWKVRSAGGSQAILEGAPLRDDSFGSANALRLWEYGVGDEFTVTTFVQLRRSDAGDYELTGDVDVELVAPDGSVRKIAAAEMSAGPVKVKIP
jgi:hypothetical protein